MTKLQIEYNDLADPFLFKCKKYFNFLIEEYNFKIIDEIIKTGGLTLIYRNDLLLITINYEYLTETIGIDIIKVPINEVFKKPLKEDVLFLLHYLKYVKPDFTTVSPNPLMNLADALKFYGQNILKGEFWISSSEIFELHQQKSKQ